MSFLKYLLAGALGGALGAAIWAIVGHLFHVELGWIAWGVGALTGVSVRLACKGKEEGFEPGMAAAVVALAAVLAGKYSAFELALNEAFAEQKATPELAIASIADEIAIEQGLRNETVDWPDDGQDLSRVAGDDWPSPDTTYTPEIWSQARARWSALGPQAQDERLARMQAQLTGSTELVKGALRQVGFGTCFGPFDLLWLCLAVASAYKIASGQAGPLSAPRVS